VKRHPDILKIWLKAVGFGKARCNSRRRCTVASEFSRLSPHPSYFLPNAPSLSSRRKLMSSAYIYEAWLIISSLERARYLSCATQAVSQCWQAGAGPGLTAPALRCDSPQGESNPNTKRSSSRRYTIAAQLDLQDHADQHPDYTHDDDGLCARVRVGLNSWVPCVGASKDDKYLHSKATATRIYTVMIRD